MPVQDDVREIEIRNLFRLEKRGGRGDTDAVLSLRGRETGFELKSTTKDSVSTVRDLGLDHIKKWGTLHWVVGVYEGEPPRLVRCYHATPLQMKPWVDRIASYAAADFKLATLVPQLIGPTEMRAIVGRKRKYTRADAERLHKKQLTKAEYLKMMDRPDGYSPKQMLGILRARCAYIIDRGATLNNPHIPLAHFAACTEISSRHAATLRELVEEYEASAKCD